MYSFHYAIYGRCFLKKIDFLYQETATTTTNYFATYQCQGAGFFGSPKYMKANIS